MTLKQKFIKESLDIRFQVLEPAKFEKIADDYAIEFVEWKANLEYSFSDKYTTKELLEIFKKQNGL
jgi:hypothetical protein